MAEYFEDEALQPEDDSGSGVRRKRVRRKKKRAGGSSPGVASPIGAKKENRRCDRKVKKEAIARLDLSGRHKLSTIQVIWVIICGTVLFFAVGIISLDLIYNQDTSGEVTESDGPQAEVVPWAESVPDSGKDETVVRTSSGEIPTIADFESTGDDPVAAGGAERPKTAQAYQLEIPPAESGIGQQRDQLITQAYENRMYDQAIELGLEELERNRSSPSVRYRLAQAYRDSGQPRKAIEMFEEQWKRTEDTSMKMLCLIALAKMAESGEGDTPPMEYFDRAMKMDSGHPALLKEFSFYLRRNQRFQEGYYHTRRELGRITPDDLATTRLKLAALQARLFDPYLESHQKEVRRDDVSGFASMTEAGRLMIDDQSEKAIEWIRRARLKLGDQAGQFYAMVRDPIFQPVQSEFIESRETVPNQQASTGKEAAAPSPPPTIQSFDLEMPEDLTPLDQ